MQSYQNDILKVNGGSKLTLSIIDKKEINPSIPKQLTSYQRIVVPYDIIAELYTEKSNLLYEEECDLYQEAINSYNISQTHLLSSWNNSRYIGMYEKYMANPVYLAQQYQEKLSVEIHVVGAERLINLDRRPNVLKDFIVGHNKIRDTGYDPNNVFPQYTFNIPDKIICKKFTSTTYVKDCRIPSAYNSLNTIAINLPYTFYLQQPLDPATYMWDIVNERHQFGPYSSDEFDKMLLDVATNGITTPLVMNFDNGVLNSDDDETNIKLFIAKILQLPYIPVVVYISMELVGANAFLLGIESINNNAITSNNGYIEYASNIFSPYWLFQSDSSKTINKAPLLTYTEIGLFSNYKLYTLKNPEDIGKTPPIPEKEIDAIHVDMMKKEQDSINSEIDRIINSLKDK